MNREIKRYFASIPETRAERLKSIHELIVRIFPEAEQSMKYRMPTYEVNKNWLAIANQKAYISVYTCTPEMIRPYVGAASSL